MRNYFGAARWTFHHSILAVKELRFATFVGKEATRGVTIESISADKTLY